jgi:hypothetical protein
MSNTLGGFIEENAWILIQNIHGEKQMCPIKDISIGTMLVTLQGILPVIKIEYSRESTENPIFIPRGSLLNTQQQIIPLIPLWIHPNQRFIAGNHIQTIPEITKILENDVPFYSQETDKSFIKIFISQKTFILVNGIWIESCHLSL